MDPATRHETSHVNRRNKIIKLIKGEAALFPAAPELIRGREMRQPYRQDADFYYLTGISESEAVILLIGSPKKPQSLLFLRDRDKTMERWEGERLGIKRAKRSLSVDEVRDISTLAHDLPKLVSHTQVLHYPAGINPKIDSLIWDLFQSRTGPRHNFPHTLRDARLITSEMRVRKDRGEISLLSHSVDITAQGFLSLIAQLRTWRHEIQVASLLESFFSEAGATGIAFPTIVAAGNNATCLHHVPRLKSLTRGQLVLIDAGATFGGYAGDISRTLPISGKFSSVQGDVYDVVHNALRCAVKKAKPGNSLHIVHRASLSEIVSGLCDLGVLRGRASHLIALEKYKPYFMHRTGHWLGLDVHDISPLYFLKKNQVTSSLSRPFVPGNAFTIEPGLYFDSQDTSIPKHFRGIGIRLEEDVLITASGCKVLSQRLPVSRKEVESLMGE